MKEHKHLTGLTDQQVIESRQKYGENILTPPEKEPLWKLFLEKFEDPIIRILLMAAFLSLGISFIHMEFAETIGIFFAIFLATGVGFWFEMDANKKFDVLNKVKDDTLYKALRNGDVREIPKKDIVVGDMIILNTGEEVPADGELLESVALHIDESCLTGEPIIEKTINPEEFHSDSTYPSNWAMRGTKIMEGHGIIEVRKIGDETEFGKVAEKATEMSGEETPLNQQLDKLAKFIGVAGFSLSILTFLALFFKDMLLGQVQYSFAQLSTITMVILAAVIALIKVWFPILYDAYHLAGSEKQMPKAVAKGSWFRWILYGVLAFFIQASIGYLVGINPLQTESWVTIETAGRILQYFMVAVTLIVVSIPEGLPMSVTLSLALSMRRMLQNNNLVRKMHATETMGAATVICTDKTGTLTQNQMQIYKTNFFSIPNQELISDEKSNLVKEGISVNSTAYLDHSDPEKIKALGNPTEGALLLWLDEFKADYLKIREEAEIIEQLTFSTQRKFMATIVQSTLLGKKVMYIKGAPEIVLSLCENVAYEEGLKATKTVKSEIDELLLAYQNQAMRTLGFAWEIIEDDKPRFSEGKLINSKPTFLGVVAISDPVREDVPEAVQQCLNAGIEVKIVTGDTPGTAREIGRQIGIWKDTDTDINIITGIDFEALSDDEAAQRVQKLKIMCRARPTDKQRLVQLLQRTGSIVAVTGDGTNDAPALNYAHVGLSMGSGTSVAKEASDITLLDDSFSSIATAVMWGRSLYQNIQRFILFQLTINVAAVLIVLLGSIFGRALPLTVTQMLWVNLIMDTFAAGALASLPPDKRVMKAKPRKNDAFIITKPMRVNILFVGLSFVVLLLGLLYYFSYDGLTKYELSVFFTIFVLLQFWNMFNAKAYATGKSAFHDMKKSYGFIVVALIILLGQILIVEFGGNVFRTVPLKLLDWVYIIVGTSAVLWLGELNRYLKRNKL